MSVGIEALFNAATSHASASGLFDSVNGHEPKAAPGNGLVAAVWVNDVSPLSAASGLTATTVRLELTVRLYTNMTQEPQDGIDPKVVGAADVLMAAYSGDFELGGVVRNVDLLGQHGPGLRGTAGYVTISGSMFRTLDIFLPMIINDVWSQSG